MAYDSYYQNTSLILHCDGANNGTTFTDTSVNPKTATVTNAITSTAFAQWGVSSGYFNGASRLDFAASPAFAFSTADRTLECWIKTSSMNVAIFDNRSANTSGSFYIAATTGRIGFWNGVASFEGTSNVANNAWHHLAWVWNSGSIYLYVDGVREFSGTDASDAGTSSRPLRIGMDHLGAGGVTGYIDDIRITKGVARYTTPSFSVPTEAFPDAAYPDNIGTRFALSGGPGQIARSGAPCVVGHVPVHHLNL